MRYANVAPKVSPAPIVIERRVSPLAGNSRPAFPDLPIDDQPTPAAGAEDHAEYETTGPPGTEERFSESKTICIIRQRQLDSCFILQILSRVSPIHALDVAEAQSPRSTTSCAWRADTEGMRICFDRNNKRMVKGSNLLDDDVISIFLACRTSQTEFLTTRFIKHNTFYLGPTQINPKLVHNSSPITLGNVFFEKVRA